MKFEVEALVRRNTVYVNVTHITKKHHRRRCVKSKISGVFTKRLVISQIVSQLIRQCIK